MKKTWENVNKTNFGVYFCPNHPKFILRVLPLLHIINCCKLTLYATSNLQNRENWPQFGPPIFFRYHVARYHGQLSLDIMAHHVQYQKELMIQSWENLTDRRTDGGTDRWTRVISKDAARIKSSVQKQ